MDVSIRPVFDPTAPPTVLAPHADDGLAGLYSVVSGKQAIVVQMFAGSPSAKLFDDDGDPGNAEAAELVEEHLAESRFAHTVIGRYAYELPFYAQRFRRHQPSIDAMAAALVTHVKETSCVYAPAAIGGDTDHLLTRQLALSFFCLGLPVRLYAEPAQAARNGWPGFVRTGSRATGSTSVEREWLPYLRSVPCFDIRMPTVIDLGVPAAERKLATLQILSRSLHGPHDRWQDDLQRLANPEVHRYELYWQLSQ